MSGPGLFLKIMNDNIFLCSFASDDLKLSKRRFINQATKFYNFKNINIYSPKDLTNNFKNTIQKNLSDENRAYGYGIWKPYIVLDFFDKIPNDSILQYADIGCHFNHKGLIKFFNYIRRAKKYNSLTFEYDGKFKTKDKKLVFQNYYEYEYSKFDLLKFLKVAKNKKIVNSPQIWSGSFFLKKTNKNKKFLLEWLKIMKYNNLIDNTPSANKENIGFIESRWDQSVFSILSKKYSLKKISASECEWAEDGTNRRWDHLFNYPLLAKRDLKRNFLSRFINRQKRNFRRRFYKFKI